MVLSAKEIINDNLARAKSDLNKKLCFAYLRCFTFSTV